MNKITLFVPRGKLNRNKILSTEKNYVFYFIFVLLYLFFLLSLIFGFFLRQMLTCLARYEQLLVQHGIPIPNNREDMMQPKSDLMSGVSPNQTATDTDVSTDNATIRLDSDSVFRFYFSLKHREAKPHSW